MKEQEVRKIAEEYAENKYGIATDWNTTEMLETSFNGEIVDAYIAGYNKAKEWISVLDELPDYHKWCIIKFEDNTYMADHWHVSKKWGHKLVGDRPFTNITHWKYID